MKKLSKLKLKNVVFLDENEMKMIAGGYEEYSGEYARCKAKGCTVQSDCSGSCVEWSDCPSIPTYGRKRCF